MLARALLLVAGFAAAASAAQVRAPREEKAPLSGPHQADLKRLDDHLAKDDEAAAASLLRRLQPRLDQQEHRLAAQAYREVVQRALEDLERDGAISLQRSRIEIRNPDKLERWALH